MIQTGRPRLSRLKSWTFQKCHYPKGLFERNYGSELSASSNVHWRGYNPILMMETEIAKCNGSYRPVVSYSSKSLSLRSLSFNAPKLIFISLICRNGLGRLTLKTSNTVGVKCMIKHHRFSHRVRRIALLHR